MKSFLNLLIMIVLEIFIAIYMFNMLEHKVKDIYLVEDLNMFGRLKCHNFKNAAPMLIFLLDF